MYDLFIQVTHVEKYVNTRLQSRLPWFNMSMFMEMLQNRHPEELEGDVFDLLETLGDFGSFKELMLAHKELQEGNQMDFSDLFCVTSRK
jgi:ADP-ribosylation factor-like protein 2-binding protein